MSDPAQAGSEFTLEDVAASEAEPKGTDLTAKLDGDEVPEELRGKTMAEVLTIQKGMKDALLTSEQARKNAETLAATAAAATAPPAPAPAPAPPAPEPELTEEELTELHTEHPLKAIEYMQSRAIKVAERNLESRLAPMFAGTAASVEEAARVKYADDFESIGPEIEKFIQQLPNKQVLASSQGWDDLIALMRGKNIEKIIEHKAGKVSAQAKIDAQQEQQDLTGFQGTGTAPRVAVAVPSKVEALDDIQKEIAGKLGMSLEDYVKWGAVTS